MELWEYVPCTCDDTCSCKKLGCTHHWKLKRDIRFDDFLSGFLRTFVDRCEHLNIIMAMEQEKSELNIRVKEIYPILKSLQDNWLIMSAKASERNKTLFCDDWCDDFFRHEWKFPVKKSVYHAKLYCILLPDTCVPYDTESRKKMLKQLGIEAIADYFQFLSKVREKFMEDINAHHLNLPSIRALDSPQDQLPFNRRLISLPRKDMDYGTGYLPKERQISLVIDKCFYQPRSAGNDSPRYEKEV